MTRAEVQALAAWARASERFTDLRNADLRGVDLQGIDLDEADLAGAHVSGVKWPSPGMVLMARWGRVSPSLDVELQRYMAQNHPDTLPDGSNSTFDVWKYTLPVIPFDGLEFASPVNYKPNFRLWSPGPALSALELARRLIAEKCKGR